MLAKVQLAGLFFIWLGEPIARASPAVLIGPQDISNHKLANISKRRIAGALGQLGILGVRKKSLKIVKHSIDDKPLSIIHGSEIDSTPQLGLAYHPAEKLVRIFNSAIEAA